MFWCLYMFKRIHQSYPKTRSNFQKKKHTPPKIIFLLTLKNDMFFGWRGIFWLNVTTGWDCIWKNIKCVTQKLLRLIWFWDMFCLHMWSSIISEKKCAPTFPIPTFPLSPKWWILTIWANLSQYWPINWLFGQNKSEKYFLLEHSPKHSHRTNLTDLWLLVTPQTLFNHWFSTIVQKIDFDHFWHFFTSRVELFWENYSSKPKKKLTRA